VDRQRPHLIVDQSLAAASTYGWWTSSNMGRNFAQLAPLRCEVFYELLFSSIFAMRSIAITLTLRLLFLSARANLSDSIASLQGYESSEFCTAVGLQRIPVLGRA
jgi:hypothetical protein